MTGPGLVRAVVKELLKVLSIGCRVVTMLVVLLLVLGVVMGLGEPVVE